MPEQDLLVLDYPDFNRRVGSFFREVEESATLRNEFLADPTGVLQARVFTGLPEIGTGELNQANRFLFSLLSNKEFMDWAAQWQRDHPEAAAGEAGEQWSFRYDKTQLYRELTEAIVRFGDKEMLQALALAHAESTVPGEPRSHEEPAFAESLRMPPPPKPVMMTVLWIIAGAAIVILILIPPLVAKPEALTREEIRAAADTLMSQLEGRAEEMRGSGELGKVEPAEGT
jgi:hypothetical protein